MFVTGTPGIDGAPGVGIGGGLGRVPSSNTTIANTNITGNSASTSDNDVTAASLERL